MSTVAVAPLIEQFVAESGHAQLASPATRQHLLCDAGWVQLCIYLVKTCCMSRKLVWAYRRDSVFGFGAYRNFLTHTHIYILSGIRIF